MTRFWEGQDPIGARISVDNGRTWATVVGIARNVRQFGLDREAVAQVYVPLRQTPFGLAGRVLVRTNGDPSLAAGMLRQTIHALDRHAGGEHADARRAARHVSHDAAADGDAAGDLRRPRALRDDDRDYRRDRDIGVRADAGVRRPHGARCDARRRALPW